MGPLENTKSLCLFLRKQAEKYLPNVCRTGEETSKKCGFLNMEFKRRHRPEMLYRTDWLIEQQIAWYFSRISALTKAGLLKRFSSVSMNKDEEVDADDLVSETDRTIRRDLEKFRRRLQGRVQLTAATGYKINTDLCISLSSQIYRLYPWKQLDMSLGFFITGNLQEAYWSKYCWLILRVAQFKVGKWALATLDRERCRFTCRYRMLEKKGRYFTIEVSRYI